MSSKFSSHRSKLLSFFLLSFFLLAGGNCDKKVYQQPCGSPCKYGDHLIYVQTTGLKDTARLQAILDSLGLQRKADFKVEARYLIANELGIKWLGERKEKMTLSEYNERLNADLELFAPGMDYFYREVLYSKEKLTGERETLTKLREALNMQVRSEDDIIGYVNDLCSAYQSGCEKPYPSIIPIHKFGVKAANPPATQWTRDSVLKNFPFMKDMDLSFYGTREKGGAKFYTNERERTVSFGIDLKGLSCQEIQKLGYKLGGHPDIRGMKGGAALPKATPIGCSKKEVKRRKEADL